MTKPQSSPQKPTAESADRAKDLALVERAKAGDHEAYRELVETYQRRAQAIALGLLGNFDDAQDLVQQAFLKAYRSLGSFRGQSSFYTWLYRIIVNLSIDLSRKAYRRSEQSFDDAAIVDALAQRAPALGEGYIGHLDNPDQYLRRQELQKRLRAALAELSDEHRAVIILREIEGLSYTEISEAVGCSKGTVMSRLHHARKRLQKVLADLMPEQNASSNEDAGSDQEGSDHAGADPEEAEKAELRTRE